MSNDRGREERKESEHMNKKIILIKNPTKNPICLIWHIQDDNNFHF
jgi:hypothetical protein